MPFSIRQDVFTGPPPIVGGTPGGIVSGRSLRNELGIPASGGSTIDAAVPQVAEQNWMRFLDQVRADTASAPTRLQRNLAMNQAREFDFQAVPEAEECFRWLWKLVRAARALKARHKDEIKDDIKLGYKHIARLAYGAIPSEFGGIVTFERIVERSDERFVIFSDHHFTNFPNMPNYFLENNFELYLRVLDHYATTDYCLVENGDVEDCILWEPTPDESRDLWRTAAWDAAGRVRPIDPDAGRWEDFMRMRADRRLRVLEDIDSEFGPYYQRIRDNFRADDRYVRLSGNHDTYTNNVHEEDLLAHISSKIDAPIHDVLRIHRGALDAPDNITHLVMHGHQIDTACLQHGETPWALTLGEVFSECLSWAFQGPDRFWKEFDSNRWHVKDEPYPFNNTLATADHVSVLVASAKALEDLDDDEMDEVERDFLQTLLAGTILGNHDRDWFELALGNEIAWEYFELDRAAEIFGMEVLTGEDQWKFRHMAEDTLCVDYVDLLTELYEQDKESGRTVPPVSEMPKIVLGHTHEVRQNSAMPGGDPSDATSLYLNTGSAGRFAGLIWGVEIDGDEERVISWSETVEGRLRKIVWTPDGDQLVPGPSTEF